VINFVDELSADLHMRYKPWFLSSFVSIICLICGWSFVIIFSLRSLLFQLLIECLNSRFHRRNLPVEFCEVWLSKQITGRNSDWLKIWILHPMISIGNRHWKILRKFVHIVCISSGLCFNFCSNLLRNKRVIDVQISVKILDWNWTNLCSCLRFPIESLWEKSY
jgi:hypothetical protein